MRTQEGLVLLCGVALTAVTAGCSQTSSDAAPPPLASAATSVAATSSTTPFFVAGDDCVSVTGHNYARRGDLSIGPFFADALHVPKSGEAAVVKVWVASQRSGVDDAVLKVTDPDGATESQTRKSGVSFVGTARQFYPGTIRLSGSGKYQIDVRVGTDRLCVMADYRVDQ